MAAIGTVEVWALIRMDDDPKDLWIKYSELHVGVEYQQAALHRDVTHCLKFANEVREVKIVKVPDVSR